LYSKHGLSFKSDANVYQMVLNPIQGNRESLKGNSGWFIQGSRGKLARIQQSLRIHSIKNTKNKEIQNMPDNLLHEISQATKYQNDRDVEFKAERFIRQFVSMVHPHIMDELYTLVESKIFENKSSDDEIAMFKMIQTLIKRKVTF